MKNMTILTQTIMLFLMAVVYIQPAQSEEIDSSWNQVFNFQFNLARHGNSRAQFILGEMYQKGRGVKQDLNTALLWYRKAEKSGSKKAAARIATIQQTMQNEAREKARNAAQKARQAKEQAHQRALQKQREAEAQVHQQALQKQHEAEVQAYQQALQKQREAEAQVHQRKLLKQPLTTSAAITKRLTPASVETTVSTAASGKATANTSQQAIDHGLSPEERAKKIKEANERVQEIVRQNALHQQQKAEAALEKYRAAMKQSSQRQTTTNAATRYQDPFE